MTWSLAQSEITGQGTGTATTGNFGSTPGASDIILISVFNQTGSTAPTSVKDSNGTNATLLNHNSTGNYLAQYAIPASSALNFTVTLASAALFINVFDFHNTLGTVTGTVDGTPGVANGTSSGGPPTSTASFSPSVTTTQNDLIFTSIGFKSGTPGSGSLAINTGSGGGASYTKGLENLGSTLTRLCDAYAFETGTGTFNPFWTWTTARSCNLLTTAIAPPAAQAGNTAGMMPFFMERAKNGLDVLKRWLILPDDELRRTRGGLVLA